MEFTWEGRRLQTASAGGKDIGYAYNSDGIRTGKTVDGVTTSYFLDGSTVIAQKTGDDDLWFLYDSDGTRVGFTYNGAAYYYTANAQGDVTGIVDKDCNTVVEYSYDAWGKLLGTTGSLADTVGKVNPFLYRGYYYDAETGLYYLNSRYYDPQTGRFLSEDGEINAELSGANLFSYCGNNPVSRIDSDGNSWWQVALKVVAIVAVVAVVTAAVVLTAGAAAVALGASATVISGVMTGAAIGGVTAGVVSVGVQMARNKGDIKKVSPKKVAKDTFTGSVTGAVSGGASGAAPATPTAIHLLVQKGFQVAANVMISDTAYYLQSARDGNFSGHGLALATGSGIISGATFNAPAGKAFIISLGLGVASSYDDLISIFGESKTAQLQR